MLPSLLSKDSISMKSASYLCTLTTIYPRIKIGGDHGGGTFKISLRVLNLERPNSRNNTNVILCFASKDYHGNLDRTLAPFKSQMGDAEIHDLEGEKGLRTQDNFIDLHTDYM